MARKMHIVKNKEKLLKKCALLAEFGFRQAVFLGKN
jgi:hypothetical protein